MGRRADEYLARLDASDRPLRVEEAREFRRLATLDNLDATYAALRDDDETESRRGGQR